MIKKRTFKIQQETILGDELLIQKHQPSGQRFDFSLLRSGTRWYGGTILVTAESLTTTSTSYVNIRDFVFIPDFKPPACRLLLFPVIYMQNTTSGYRVYWRMYDRDTGEVYIELKTDLTTVSKCYFGEVDFTNYAGCRQIRMQWRVTGGTGKLWKSSTIYILYEVM